MERQTLLGKPRVKYSLGAYNKMNKEEQWIRLTEGCPNNCPYCYEPTEFKIFKIPSIDRKTVKIMDMNLIAKPEAMDIIKELGQKRVEGKKVTYELICGIDYRYLTQELADALKKNRFINPRLAWDWKIKEQKKVKAAVDMLKKAGFPAKEIMIFILCNWRISTEEVYYKLDVMKVWGVRVSDCYFDNQTFPNIQPRYWSYEQCKAFRHKCRLHNQIVKTGVYSELKGFQL